MPDSDNQDYLNDGPTEEQLQKFIDSMAWSIMPTESDRSRVICNVRGYHNFLVTQARKKAHSDDDPCYYHHRVWGAIQELCFRCSCVSLPWWRFIARQRLHARMEALRDASEAAREASEDCDKRLLRWRGKPE